MALPALLSGLGRQLAVQGAKGAAKGTAQKMLGGRKQEKNSNAIAKQQEKDSVGYKKSSALVPSIKPINFGAPPPSPEVSSSTKGDDGSLLTIKEKVIKIENLLGEQYKNRKKQAEKKRKLSERAERSQREEGLEQVDKKTKKVKGLSIPIPGKGLFDRLISGLFNFIFWVGLGKIFPQLQKMLPTLISIGKVLASIGNFIIDALGTVLNIVVNVIDTGYKIYDKVKEFAGNIGGDGLVKVFEDFSDVVGKVLNVLLILSMAQGLGGGSGLGRGGQVGIQGARNQAGRVTRGGTTSQAARRFADRYGRDAAIKKFGQEGVESLGGRYARSGVTNLARKGAVAILGKGGTKASLKFVKKFITPIVKKIPIIGGLIDFALNYFVFKEPIGRAAFAAIGSTIFGALGATAGSIIPFAGNFVGGALGGLAGDIAGKWLYDTFFDKKKPVEVGDRDSSLNKAKGSDYSSTGFSTGTDTAPITSLGSGGGSLKDMTDQDFSDLAFIVSHEALRNTDDEYGVAAAVLNRVADPRFPNTIMGVGTAPNQFEAVFKGKAYRDPKLAEKLKNNQDKIVEALKKLNGRTDFKAVSSMGQYMGSTDIMFAKNGNFYHYAEQKAKTDPIPSSIPQDWKKLLGQSTEKKSTSINTSPSPTPSPSPSSTSDTDSSSNERGEGSKLAGELGRFIKTKLKSPEHFSQVHRHPEHPPWGKESGHSANSLHYESQGARALDIGAWTYEQQPILDVISQFNKKKGVNPVELLHGKNEPNYHHNHVHVAYEGGGLIRPRGSMSLPNSFASYNSPKPKTKVIVVKQPVPVPSGSNVSPSISKSTGGFVEMSALNNKKHTHALSRS